MKINEKIIKVGFAKYDRTIPYKIEIIETNFKPGSGDYEDPPEIQNDQYGKFYKIKYYSPLDSKFTTEEHGYETLIDAISKAEEKTGEIKWEKLMA